MPFPASARKRKPHGPGAKPRHIVAGGRRQGRTAKANAEGLLLRMVARLAVDAQASGTARDAHGYFVDGCLAMLEATGAVRRDRLITLRTACNELLDGRLTMQDVRAMKSPGTEPDPNYLRAVSLVRRAGHADAARLAGEMNIGPRDARELIERMRARGVVGEPDMFGSQPVLSGEVRHG